MEGRNARSFTKNVKRGSDPIYDVGTGAPIVLIPGIQGRWEWMRPSVHALAARWRVITSSLPGEPGVDVAPESDRDFDGYMRHVDRLLDSARVSSAVICGVSFGGLIALRYAARRPERVHALILVSTPGPGWTPTPQQLTYMRWPAITSPLSSWNDFSILWGSRGGRSPTSPRT